MGIRLVVVQLLLGLCLPSQQLQPQRQLEAAADDLQLHLTDWLDVDLEAAPSARAPAQQKRPPSAAGQPSVAKSGQPRPAVQPQVSKLNAAKGAVARPPKATPEQVAKSRAAQLLADAAKRLKTAMGQPKKATEAQPSNLSSEQSKLLVQAAKQMLDPAQASKDKYFVTLGPAKASNGKVDKPEMPGSAKASNEKVDKPKMPGLAKASNEKGDKPEMPGPAKAPNGKGGKPDLLHPPWSRGPNMRCGGTSEAYMTIRLEGGNCNQLEDISQAVLLARHLNRTLVLPDLLERDYATGPFRSIPLQQRYDLEALQNGLKALGVRSVTRLPCNENIFKALPMIPKRLGRKSPDAYVKTVPAAMSDMSVLRAGNLFYAICPGMVESGGRLSEKTSSNIHAQIAVLKSFRLNPDLRISFVNQLVKRMRDQYGKFLALHFRCEGDWIKFGQGGECHDDLERIATMIRQLNLLPKGGGIYVAGGFTDKRMFEKPLADYNIVFKTDLLPKIRRLKFDTAGAVEMEVCIESDIFIGNGKSSMSEFIYWQRYEEHKRSELYSAWDEAGVNKPGSCWSPQTLYAGHIWDHRQPVFPGSEAARAIAAPKQFDQD